MQAGAQRGREGQKLLRTALRFIDGARRGLQLTQRGVEGGQVERPLAQPHLRRREEQAEF